MKVVVIDYNAGNVHSVIHALKRLGIQPALTHQPEEIRRADKVIFPGVGEASSTMQFLRRQRLDQLIPELQQPVLGICLGMQLMCQHSEENDTVGMGIFPLRVRRFPRSSGLKVPHMGWNQVQRHPDSWLPTGPSSNYSYFAHSYYVETGENTVATADHILHFSAALRKQNFYATQFHPEESCKYGAQVLAAFLEQ